MRPRTLDGLDGRISSPPASCCAAPSKPAGATSPTRATPARTYRLRLPAPIPAQDFWSLLVYDPQTRSMLQTGQRFPGLSSQHAGLVVNPDSAVDVYFSPQPPLGKPANWIQTVPGKGWFVALRLYAPLEPWFDQTWRPGEIELAP
jgi:hypothetical protein